MLRAMTYTVLFCGISAGAAFSLAIAHDATSPRLALAPVAAEPDQRAIAPRLDPAPVPVAYDPMPVAPQPQQIAPRTPQLTLQEDAPVQAVPTAPIAAPVEKARIEIPSLVTTPNATLTAPRITKVTPAPKAVKKPRAVVSTQNTRGLSRSTDFTNRSESFNRGPATEQPILRSATVQPLARGTTSGGLGNTWTTGVYR